MADDDRAIMLQEIEALPPLDALYRVADFNRRCSEKIDPAALSLLFSATELDDAIRQVNALWHDEGYFGEKAWTGRGKPAVIAEMRERHPGFSEQTYELALMRGRIAMR